MGRQEPPPPAALALDIGRITLASTREGVQVAHEAIEDNQHDSSCGSSATKMLGLNLVVAY